MKKSELIEQILELDPAADVAEMSFKQLTEALDTLTAPGEVESKDAEPEQAEKAVAYVVCEKHSVVTGKRGIIGAGKKITADDFNGDASAIQYHVDRGHIREVK